MKKLKSRCISTGETFICYAINANFASRKTAQILWQVKPLLSTTCRFQRDKSKLKSFCFRGKYKCRDPSRAVLPEHFLSGLFCSSSRPQQSPEPRVECCESHLFQQGQQLHHPCSVGCTDSFSRTTHVDLRLDSETVAESGLSFPSFSRLCKPCGIPSVAIFRTNITPLFLRHQIIGLPKKTSYFHHWRK